MCYHFIKIQCLLSHNPIHIFNHKMFFEQKTPHVKAIKRILDGKLRPPITWFKTRDVIILDKVTQGHWSGNSTPECSYAVHMLVFSLN